MIMNMVVGRAGTASDIEAAAADMAAAAAALVYIERELAEMVSKQARPCNPLAAKP